MPRVRYRDDTRGLSDVRGAAGQRVRTPDDRTGQETHVGTNGDAGRANHMGKDGDASRAKPTWVQTATPVARTTWVDGDASRAKPTWVQTARPVARNPRRYRPRGPV